MKRKNPRVADAGVLAGVEVKSWVALHILGRGVAALDGFGAHDLASDLQELPGEDAFCRHAVLDSDVTHGGDAHRATEDTEGLGDLDGALGAEPHDLLLDDHRVIIRVDLSHALDDLDALVGEPNDQVHLLGQASQEGDGIAVLVVPELIAEPGDLLHDGLADAGEVIDRVLVRELVHDRLVVPDLGPGHARVRLEVDAVLVEEVHDHPASHLELVVEHGLVGDLGEAMGSLRVGPEEDEAELGVEGDVGDVGAHEG